MRLNERTDDTVELFKRLKDSIGMEIRVSVPGIIESVDFNKLTCSVRVAIKEKLNINGNINDVEIPTLLDVPFFINSGGGYCVTLPISKGDDCLVVFGDNCIDAWWQSGGIQNQIERRRHDLSDGFAIVGFRSQPNTISGYSPDTVQLRNSNGDACIEISGSTINIKAAGGVNISGGTTIDGINFKPHTHGGVQPGGGSTSGVNG